MFISKIVAPNERLLRRRTFKNTYLPLLYMAKMWDGTSEWRNGGKKRGEGERAVWWQLLCPHSIHPSCLSPLLLIWCVPCLGDRVSSKTHYHIVYPPWLRHITTLFIPLETIALLTRHPSLRNIVALSAFESGTSSYCLSPLDIRITGSLFPLILLPGRCCQPPQVGKGTSRGQ